MVICGEYSLEKVLFAENLAVASETLVAELSTTLTALEALGMPRAVQHLEDEAVQDELLATPALGDTSYNIRIRILSDQIHLSMIINPN